MVGTIYVRLGPAAGVITCNKGGARVLPQRCGIYEISLLLAESELMRTTLDRLAAGCIAFDDREGLRRYTQAEVSCPSQDFYTLAPDIFGWH